MSPDIYHEKWIETMGEWLSENEKNVEGKYYVIKLKNGKKTTLNIGLWTVKGGMIKRLMIRLAWFYKYPYSLEAEIRRIEILDDKVFYVIPGDVVKVLEYVPWKKVLRKDEVKIDNPNDVFRFLNELSKYFSDEAREDLVRLVNIVSSYESYVEY